MSIYFFKGPGLNSSSMVSSKSDKTLLVFNLLMALSGLSVVSCETGDDSFESV